MKRFVGYLLASTLSAGLAACSLFPQQNVRFSEHEVSRGDGVISMSYPATLRASTMSFALRPDIPPYAFNQLIGLRAELTDARSQLERCQTRKNTRIPIFCGDEHSAVDAANAKIADITAVWGKVRILAEPPPDAAASVNVVLKGNAGTTGTPESAEASLNTTITQIKLATESDVKRHMAYRLNEALFNHPTLIQGSYVSLFREIVNYSPTMTPAPSAAAKNVPVEKKTPVKICLAASTVRPVKPTDCHDDTKLAADKVLQQVCIRFNRCVAKSQIAVSGE